MPWWIWLILVAFMLTVLIVGIVYVARHAINAFHKVAGVGNAVSERLSSEGETKEQRLKKQVAFSEPLKYSIDRYSKYHASVIKRRIDRRNRHVRQWSNWRRFNE